MNGLKILAWILIVLQAIGMVGTLINGGNLLNISFENVYVFINDLAVTLGYYALGIIGFICLIIDSKTSHSQKPTPKPEYTLGNFDVSKEVKKNLRKLRLQESAKAFVWSGAVAFLLGFIVAFAPVSKGNDFNSLVFVVFLALSVICFAISYILKKLYDK